MTTWRHSLLAFCANRTKTSLFKKPFIERLFSFQKYRRCCVLRAMQEATPCVHECQESLTLGETIRLKYQNVLLA